MRVAEKNSTSQINSPNSLSFVVAKIWPSPEDRSKQTLDSNSSPKLPYDVAVNVELYSECPPGSVFKRNFVFPIGRSSENLFFHPGYVSSNSIEVLGWNDFLTLKFSGSFLDADWSESIWFWRLDHLVPLKHKVVWAMMFLISWMVCFNSFSCSSGSSWRRTWISYQF